MRKSFILCLTLMFFTLVAFGQNNFVFKPVFLSINSENGQYAAGETVNVYGELMEDIGGGLVCYVEANGRVIQEKKMVELMLGEKTLVYSASFDEPTAVQVYVHHKDNEKSKAAVGFVVAAELISPKGGALLPLRTGAPSVIRMV